MVNTLLIKRAHPEISLVFTLAKCIRFGVRSAIIRVIHGIAKGN
jgi:hypothetical protein